MKIYTLENKNSEVLAILTHSDNMNYRDFKRICLEANNEAESDYYILKDILVSDYGFKTVERIGGFEVNKKKGSL